MVFLFPQIPQSDRDGLVLRKQKILDDVDAY
jgi:hypothetical protein